MMRRSAGVAALLIVLVAQASPSGALASGRLEVREVVLPHALCPRCPSE